MTIGLTTRELIKEFISASSKYHKEVNKAIYDSITDEDIEIKSLITEIRESNPNTTIEQLNNTLVIIFSIAEIIAKNNEKLAEVIPHN